MATVTKRSLHIGVDTTTEAQLVGFDARSAPSCEDNAKFMERIATANGFTPKLLVGQDATARKITAEITSAASALPENALFLLTFAGHGTQMKSRNKECGKPELFGHDQAWGAFDRPLLDDELRRICWPEFKTGNRVFVIIDACHSGTFIEYALLKLWRLFGFDSKRYSGGIPPAYTRKIIARNRELYRKIEEDLPPCRDVVAKIHALAACDDVTKTPHPVGFSDVIRKVWDNGSFTGSYESFWTAINAEAVSRGLKPQRCCVTDTAFWATDLFQLVPHLPLPTTPTPPPLPRPAHDPASPPP